MTGWWWVLEGFIWVPRRRGGGEGIIQIYNSWPMISHLRIQFWSPNTIAKLGVIFGTENVEKEKMKCVGGF